eukprot:SM000128S26201  [mRNA]  locus=s128:54940:55472:- [translate_table: standard]
MSPVLQEVARRLKDRLSVVKIDTERYPALASRYNIHALPTFVLFKDGQPVQRVEGAMSADDLVRSISANL